MTLTTTRLRWLKQLRYGGKTRWGKMPMTVGRRVGFVSRQTWRPMVDAGLITAEFDRGDWWFRITADGLIRLESQR